MAAKPGSPVTVNCAAVSSSGNVYTAECDVQPIGKKSPQNVRLIEPQTEGVSLISSTPPEDDGTGKWIITLGMPQPKSITLQFEVRYSKTSVIRVGGVYNPSPETGSMAPKKGRVITDKSGNKIQELPSK